jgi:hypothetical protein
MRRGLPQLAFRPEPILPLAALFAAAFFIELIGATGDLVVGRLAREALDLVRDIARRGRHGG